MKKLIIIFVLFSTTSLFNAYGAKENAMARKIGEAELKNYVLKCGNSWFLKRITHGIVELNRNGSVYLNESTRTESEILNGLEYKGTLSFIYAGPQRELMDESGKWSEDSFAIDIDIVKMKGNWSAKKSQDLFRGATYVKITCEDVPGQKKNVGEQVEPTRTNMRNILRQVQANLALFREAYNNGNDNNKTSKYMNVAIDKMSSALEIAYSLKDQAALAKLLSMKESLLRAREAHQNGSILNLRWELDMTGGKIQRFIGIDKNTNLPQPSETNKEEEYGKIKELEGEIGKKEVILKSLQVLMPTERETSGLINRLQETVYNSNLKTLRLSIRRSIDRGIYREQPMLVYLSGSLRDLAIYFDALSNYDRLINVEAIKLVKKELGVDGEVLYLEFTLKTFFFNTGATAPDAPNDHPGSIEQEKIKLLNRQNNDFGKMIELLKRLRVEQEAIPAKFKSSLSNR